MVDTHSKNYLTIALEEVAGGQDQVPLPVGGPEHRQAAQGTRDGPDPPRRQRRDRRLQGARVRAPGDEGRPRRARRPDARRASASSAPPSFAALTGAPVLTTEWERDPARGAFPDQPPPDHDPLSHLELVRNADVLLVAPATANTIAKLAHGLADNLLTSAALAVDLPAACVAPAMNHHMWEHPATQANVATLRERGATIVDPGVGALGQQGRVGRRPPAPSPPSCWRPSRRSSRPGAAPVGRPARARHRGRHARADRRGPLRRQPLVGADGLRARRARPPRRGAAGHGRRRQRRAAALAARRATSTSTTAAELRDGLRRARSPDCDVLLMAAAVADFTPADAGRRQAQEGRPRRGSTVELERDDGRARRRWRRARRPGQIARRLRRRARRRRARLRARQARGARALDAIVVNDVSGADIGFDAVDNEVTIVTAARRAPRAARHEGRGRARDPRARSTPCAAPSEAPAT